MSEPNEEVSEEEYVALQRAEREKGARKALEWLDAALDAAGAPPCDRRGVDGLVEEGLLTRLNWLADFVDQVDVALGQRPNRALPIRGQERRLEVIKELRYELDAWRNGHKQSTGQVENGPLHPLARAVLDAIRASGPNDPSNLETVRIVAWRKAEYPMVDPYDPNFVTHEDIELGKVSARHFANEGLLRELMRELDRLEYPTVPYEDLRVGLIGRLEQGRKQWGTGTVPRPTRFPTYDDGRRAAASDLAIRLGVEHPASAATIDARISELLRAEEAHKRVREVGLVIDEVDAIPRSAPLPSWEEVADSLERLHVPGGTLYRSIRWDADGDRSPSAPVFVPDRVSG